MALGQGVGRGRGRGVDLDDLVLEGVGQQAQLSRVKGLRHGLSGGVRRRGRRGEGRAEGAGELGVNMGLAGAHRSSER